jgi:hypothetical protein
VAFRPRLAEGLVFSGESFELHGIVNSEIRVFVKEYLRRCSYPFMAMRRILLKRLPLSLLGSLSRVRTVAEATMRLRVA